MGATTCSQKTWQRQICEKFHKGWAWTLVICKLYSSKQKFPSEATSSNRSDQAVGFLLLLSKATHCDYTLLTVSSWSDTSSIVSEVRPLKILLDSQSSYQMALSSLAALPPFIRWTLKKAKITFKRWETEIKWTNSGRHIIMVIYTSSRCVRTTIHVSRGSLTDVVSGRPRIYAANTSLNST